MIQNKQIKVKDKDENKMRDLKMMDTICFKSSDSLSLTLKIN